MYEFLIKEKFDRKDMLLALGGGVTGDLTGFVAATYLRGVDFIQIPTTLLAQADSSIGGKTGVDFDGYKNMVGAFKMPRLVYMNVAALKTLEDSGYLDREEVKCSRKVLTAAALTYVAALFTAIAQLVRLIAISNRRN